MSRRHAATKRQILPDPKFNDLVVAKFANSLMLDGKKSVAESILYGAFDIIEKKTGSEALKTFHDALENIKPMIEVRSRRVGGATYQVPVEVRSERRQALAIRWMIDTARKRGENKWLSGFHLKLLTRQTIEAQQSKKGKIPIKWQRRIRPSLIIVGREKVI